MAKTATIAYLWNAPVHCSERHMFVPDDWDEARASDHVDEIWDKFQVYLPDGFTVEPNNAGDLTLYYGDKPCYIHGRRRSVQGFGRGAAAQPVWLKVVDDK